MKFYQTIFAGTLCLVALAACGTKDEEVKKEDYSYDFTENQCPTGKQSFSSLADLCAGLQNETLNHGCAQSLRRNEFTQRCPNQTFTPTN